jgi:hypothetical protein
MIKVIGTEGNVLQRVIEQVFGMFVPEGKELVVVIADQLTGELAKEALETKIRPMIVCAFQMQHVPESWAVRRLLVQKDVVFGRLPLKMMETIALCQDIWSGKAVAKSIELMQFNAETIQQSVGVILHDMHPGKSVEAITRAMRSANEEFGFAGTEDEVRKQLENLREEVTSGRFVEDSIAKNKGVVAGVFCDVEGTLICEDQLIPGRLEMLAEYAKTGEVSLWTGGDTERIGALLAELGVTYPLLSKYDFAGETVEIAIDDMLEAEIEKIYSIRAEQFVRIELGQ